MKFSSELINVLKSVVDIFLFFFLSWFKILLLQNGMNNFLAVFMLLDFGLRSYLDWLWDDFHISLALLLLFQLQICFNLFA